MNNIALRCTKCSKEKSFSLESARKFNKDNRYICENCNERSKSSYDLDLPHYGYNLTSFPLSSTETTIREQVKRNIEPNVNQFPCTHGHTTRSNCPLCGFQKHRQELTWDGFELSVLAIIVLIFVVIVVAIIEINPLGPQPFDQDTKMPSVIQVPIDKKCPIGYHRAYPVISCRIN